ncbi:MAG: type II toxin-antitoxin system VapC family toxin [Thermoanaerobaculia bacterium]
MIVVDASAVVEMLLASTSGEEIAEELLASERGLHAPHLLDAEVTSALRKGWLRGVLTEERARQALEDLPDLPIERHGHVLLLERAWNLRAVLTVYDALYVALAETLAAPLLTCDARIAKATGLDIEVLVR